MGGNNSGGIIFFLGVIGAVVYFVQHSTGFWDGVLGVLKGLVWPALVVYKALELLKL